MKILYAVSEAFPFAKNGGLGDVAFALPQAIRQLGQDIQVILPLYDTIPAEYRDEMELVTNFTLELSFQTLYCGLYRLDFQGVPYYFVENELYFARGRLYGCEDDDARYAFFSRAVCEAIHYMDEIPDVVHCNDWQTALTLFYLQDKRLQEPSLRPIHTVFTIHNVEYQGNFSYQTLTDVFGLSGVLFSQGILDLDGDVNLMKGAIEIADLVTTVSPTYAQELTAPDTAGPLASVIAAHRVVGIRNGVHGHINPFDSPFVHRPYDRDSVEERVFNKLWMQEDHHLRVGEEIPVIGCVSRLLSRKGFDLLLRAIPVFLEQGAELVICGDGKQDILECFLSLRQRYPEQLSVVPFSEQRATEIYSSVDIFAMPSKIEPCGTAQLQAMRFGAVPVARATGGLRDTIVPYDAQHPQGYGFLFEDYTPEALSEALSRALAVYRDTETWEALSRRCMAQDFSWDEPAKAYILLYRELSGEDCA